MAAERVSNDLPPPRSPLLGDLRRQAAEWLDDADDDAEGGSSAGLTSSSRDSSLSAFSVSAAWGPEATPSSPQHIKKVRFHFPAEEIHPGAHIPQPGHPEAATPPVDALPSSPSIPIRLISSASRHRPTPNLCGPGVNVRRLHRKASAPSGTIPGQAL
eukprot:EG_transcript_23142